MTKYGAINPFLCMDLTYITCLLKEGFGFKDSTVLHVSEMKKRKHHKNLHILPNKCRNMFLCGFNGDPLLLVPQLAKKVNNVETSWALGATFDFFRHLNIH